jgi:hypothetical protein
MVQFLSTMVKDVFNGFTRELFKCSSAAELNDFKMFSERGFKELRKCVVPAISSQSVACLT